MKIRLISILIVFWLLSCKTSIRDRNPNIILILADDLGYSDLSCYRELIQANSVSPSTSKTPNIDKLASNGMMFTQFYSGAAVCSPSRAALLTGRNATRLGVYNWIPPNSPMHLRDKEITIAEVLRQKGYRTGHFGKWHLTSEGTEQPLPMDQGFDYAFFSYNNAKPSHKNPVNYFKNGEPVGALQGFACQLVVDEALSWLTKNEQGKSPFYMNLWFNEPHERVAAPDSLAARHHHKKQYYGSIENLDLAVARIMKYLEDQGLAENTIVIFSSDNGSQELGSNLPLRGEKVFNFEGGVRVPFIISWPGHISPGDLSETPGGFVDILPTLASITNSQLPVKRTLDGTDLSPVMLGRSEQVKRNHPLFFFRYFHDPICMIREHEWVLLGYDEPLPYKYDYDQAERAKLKPEPDEPKWSMWGFQSAHMDYLLDLRPGHFELYNIMEDPGQQNDLSDKYPEELERLKKKMLMLQEEMIAEGGNWYE